MYISRAVLLYSMLYIHRMVGFRSGFQSYLKQSTDSAPGPINLWKLVYPQRMSSADTTAATIIKSGLAIKACFFFGVTKNTRA